MNFIVAKQKMQITSLPLVAVAALFIICTSFSTVAAAAPDACYPRDSDCPSTCPHEAKGNSSLTTLFMLFKLSNTQYLENMMKAQSIIKQYSPSEIIRFDLPPLFHSSVNCTFCNKKPRQCAKLLFCFVLFLCSDFCCLSSDEKTKVGSIIKSYKFEPIVISWNWTCK